MNALLLRVTLGARYMVLSAFGFALMGMFVKLVHTRGIPVLEIVAFRSLVSAFICYGAIKRKKVALWGNRKDLLLARGIVGSLAIICVWYSLTSLPYAEATVLQYLHPMFTAILALIFLGERVQRSTLICIFCSILGLIVIVRPEFLFSRFSGDYNQFAVFAALLGALGSGVAYMLVRKLSATEDPSVIIFYFPVVALPLSVLLLGDGWVLPSGWSWLILLSVGLTTQLGQWGLTKAMQTETASKATSFSYLQVLFAALLGWMVFDELITLWTLLGGGLIIAGAFLNLFLKEK